MSISPKEYDAIRRKSWSKADRLEVAAKTKNKCAYCGKELKGRFALDHVVPLRKGGADEKENLLAACIQCNHYKGTSDLETFRRMIEDTPNQLMAKSLTGRIASAYRLLQPQNITFFFETM